MKLEEAISKRILFLCKEKSLSVNKLASMAGLSSSTISSILYGQSKNTGARTILDICEALDMTIYDFYNDPLFKSHDIEGSY